MVMSARRLRIAAAARIMPVHGTGGMQIITEELLQNLAGLGHEIDLFTTERPGQVDDVETAIESGVRVRYLRTGSPGRYSRAWFRALDRAFRRAYAERPYDVIVSVSAGARGLLSRWRRAGLSAPSVMLTFGTHVDEFRAALHSIRGHVNARGMTGGLLRAADVIYRMGRDVPFMRSADAIVTACPVDSVKIARTFGISMDRLTTIPYGVARELRDRLATVGNPESNVVTAVARLERDKGLQTALHAMPRILRQIPDARLRIVGDGAYRPELEELAQRLGIKHAVEFTGTIPFQQIDRAYAGAAVVLNPRLRPTAYDHVMVLGMATGLPLITTDFGDVRYVAEPDHETIFVPAGDADALARAVLKCLTDRALAARIGAAGAAKIARSFSIEATVAAYVELLSNL